MKTFLCLFPLLLGSCAVSGSMDGFSRSDGLFFLAVGFCACCVRWVLPFLRQAWREGSEKVAARFQVCESEPEAEPITEPESVPEPEREPISAERWLLRCAAERHGFSADRVEVSEELKRLALGAPLVEIEEEAPSADFEEDEAFYGLNQEKEKARLERVLEGLYNKRDKYNYIGVSRNTQRWRGLEYDIAAIERRLYALREV